LQPVDEQIAVCYYYESFKGLKMQLPPIPEVPAVVLTLMAMSGTLFFMKGFLEGVFSKIYSAILNTFTYTLNIYYSDSAFSDYNSWLSKNTNHMYFNRNLRFMSGKHVPGYGTSYMKVPGMPWMVVTRSQDSTKTAVYGPTDIIVFRIFNWKAKETFKKLGEMVKESNNFNKLYTNDGDTYWSNIGKLKQVNEPTDAVSMEFLNDLEKFLKSKDYFKDKKIPYKRGYLLHGMPGTGKTSLICYASNKYNIPVYTLNGLLTAKLLDTDNMLKLPAIVTIEDIDLTLYAGKRGNVEDVIETPLPTPSKKLPPKDATTVKTEKPTKDEDDDYKKHPAFLLKEFLNLLDGFMNMDGLIFIFTTNDKSKLDPALLRPGRIDRQFNLKPLNQQEQMDYIAKNAPDCVNDIAIMETCPVSILQSKITDIYLNRF
jgi:hypothetical protein